MTATVDVSLRFGPMLIGVFLNMILFGILIVQTTTYYQTYSRDALWMKIFVAYLFTLEVANSIFDMVMLYEPLITGYGSAEAASQFPRLFMTEPILMACIACPIQFFFAWRIQRITSNWWIAIAIGILALVSCAGGLWTGYEVFAVKLFVRKSDLHTPALVWFITSCVADLMITVTLVISLSQRRTGFASTDSVIDKIIRTTVQTGMITAVCAIGDVAFFMAMPKTALNFLWDLTLSKLYMNCLMSTLNSRAALQNITVSDSNRRNGEATNERRRRYTATPSRGVYELDTHTKSFGTDLEYGITVTKVVEHVEDPEPMGLSRSTQ